MIVVLIGPPGSGKGTYAQMLAKKGWIHFSIGQALRDHVKRKGPLAQKIESFISKGHLVSQPIFFSVFKDAIRRFGDKNIIFDGLPRNISQSVGMEKALKSIHPIDAYVYIDVHEKEVRDRLKKRRQCLSCGKVYGKTVKSKKKGICDACGGKLGLRNDDRPEIIHERFKVYNKETVPVLDWASARYPVFYIHGHGKPSVVFKRITRVLSLLK